jgi:monoamine oxidase
VIITTTDATSGIQTYTSSFTVCTLPLGVLKRDPPTFDPPLPPRKARAIRTLGFGLLNKIVLRYESAWWKDADKVQA